MAEVLISTIVETAVRLVLTELVPRFNITVRLDKLSIKIEGLKDKLKQIESMLKDADARRYKDANIQSYLDELRNFSYRIKDLIETYDMEVERREGKGIKKVYRRIARFMEDPFALAYLNRQIEIIKWYLRPVIRRQIPEYEDNQWARHTSSGVPGKDFVGMEKDIEGLVSVLKDRNYPVISIFGMFGTGKTAVAWKLFKHPDVRGHFEGFAWIDLGKTVERKAILQDILKQLPHQGPENEIEENEDLEFNQLYHIQQKIKCLVVLDGIESLDSFELVWAAFTSAENSSKILLTTRMREIAETAAGNGYIHQMSCLTEEEGWELLKRKASASFAPDDLDDHKKKEEIGKGIVRGCKGLPLAIEMTGDFIATTEKVEDWQQLYEEVDSFPVARESQVLASAFNELPNHLKPCFLYLSCFPEKYKIEVEKLYLFWVAEDMVASEGWDSGKAENRLEMAEEYLKELQRRSLVDVEEEELPTLRRFKACQLHELIRQWCLWERNSKEFVEVIHFNCRNQDKKDYFSKGSVRRLIMYLGKNVERFPKRLKREVTKYIRSLLIYGMDENLQGSVIPHSLSNLRHCPVLRVLEFNGVDFHHNKLPRGISKLKRLRYLSFEHCQLEALPEDIGSLPYLQVLDLRVSAEMMIPNVLWKLKRLRHLYFPRTFRILSQCKLQLGTLTELETLKHLNTNLCCVEDLLKLTNLRYLDSDTQGHIEDLEWLIRRMSMVTDHVLYCSIEVRDFECYTEERRTVFRQILGSRALHSFSIKGYLGKIPSYQTIPRRLAKIVFVGSKLKQDAMLALEKLPNLQVLVLDEEAFIGAEMSCSAEGFYELRRFQLSNLSVLEKLTIANEAFPKLYAFTVRNCAKLKIMENQMPPRLGELLRRSDGE